jgi:hypothetical protein
VRESEAVAADQPCLAVVLLEEKAPDPVAVFGAGSEQALGLDAFEAHPVLP